jgi:EAL and modified HD-GYP domain-containing signal transduction protein
MDTFDNSETMGDRVSREVFIGRQPIFDTNAKIFAYELLFRNKFGNGLGMESESQGTARLIADIFSDLGLDRVLGGNLGLVNIGEEFLLSDMVLLLPSDKLILEILETVPVTETVIDRCRELKSRGFTLALDDYVGDEEHLDPLLPLVDIVKVDVLDMPRETMNSISQSLLKRKLKLLAEKVEHIEQVKFASGLGYSYFQGFFFARPSVFQSRTMDPMVSALMGILSLVLNDAPTNEVVDAIKPHIELSLSIVKLANIVGTTPSLKVTSVRQAILSMGRNQLTRWIQLLLLSNAPSGNRYSRPVFHLAMTRARVMELLAALWKGPDEPNHDLAFMVGMLSLADVLMDTSLSHLLGEIPVDPTVKEALLEGRGPLGLLLVLSQKLERSDLEGMKNLLSRIPISVEKIFSVHTESLLWADEISRHFS